MECKVKTESPIERILQLSEREMMVSWTVIVAIEMEKDD